MGTEGRAILVVEDNPKDLKLTLHALRKLASNIDVARDGEEALDYLFCRGAYQDRRFEDAPKVVLLDLKLPKLDGLDVLRTLKGDTRTRAVPIVIMTSSKEEQDMVDSYHLGTNAYIQKPVDFDAFQRIVEQLGLFWLEINQAPPPAAFSKK